MPIFPARVLDQNFISEPLAASPTYSDELLLAQRADNPYGDAITATTAVAIMLFNARPTVPEDRKKAEWQAYLNAQKLRETYTDPDNAQNTAANREQITEGINWVSGQKLKAAPSGQMDPHAQAAYWVRYYYTRPQDKPPFDNPFQN